MPKCGCAGSSCSCLIVGGRNISTGGTGSIVDPYVVDFTIPEYRVTHSSGNIDLSEMGGRTSVEVILTGEVPTAGDWILPDDAFDMTIGIVNNTGSTISLIPMPAGVVGAGSFSLSANYTRLFRMASIPGGGVLSTAGFSMATIQ